MTFISDSSLKTVQTGLLYFSDEFGGKTGVQFRIGVSECIPDVDLIHSIEQESNGRNDRRCSQRIRLWKKKKMQQYADKLRQFVMGHTEDVLKNPRSLSVSFY